MPLLQFRNVSLDRHKLSFFVVYLKAICTSDDRPLLLGVRTCRFQKLDTCVPVMQSAQDCMGDDIPDALDRAPVRCILAERNMRTPSIVISGEFRKDPPQVLFVEHNQMIGTLAPDRPDQAFNMAVLPGRAE